MTKPTGRPRGRPKTREYATLMARIPQDLVDQVQRYAGLHRQSISMVIREGLHLLLESDSYTDFVSDRKSTIASFMSDSNGSDQAAGTARQGESPTLVPENVSDSKAALPDIMSDTNGTPLEIVSDMKGALSAIVSDTKAAATAPRAETPQRLRADKMSDRNGAVCERTVEQTARPLFDATKYILGKLCPRGHDDHGTGQSLLRLSNRHCLACDREKFHERKQAKRHTQPA